MSVIFSGFISISMMYMMMCMLMMHNFSCMKIKQRIIKDF